jgi:hypothetical protein
MADGREDQDTSRRTDETISFTPHGIVYSFSEPHDDPSLKGDKYMDYYAMSYQGRLWRGNSWGGTKSPKGRTLRAQRFANDVYVESLKLEGKKPESSLIKENIELIETVEGLVDLVLRWMNGALRKIGVTWAGPEDYPPALQRGMKILGMGGEDSIGGN